MYIPCRDYDVEIIFNSVDKLHEITVINALVEIAFLGNALEARACLVVVICRRHHLPHVIVNSLNLPE